MKLASWLELGALGLSTVLLRRERPLLATLILTDACNLACQGCAVSNVQRRHAPFAQVRAEMQALYREGLRILIFCGGEPALWRDGERDLHDLIAAARAIGFPLVSLVTNGTLGVQYPDADVVFVSLDGLQPEHDRVRGPTFARILARIEESAGVNLCVFSTLTQVSYRCLPELVRFVSAHPKLGAISFNFHTPYAGTEELCLDREQEAWCIRTLGELQRAGHLIVNLPSQLPRHLSGQWRRPCRQCLIWEDGRRWICGRCRDIPGLCERCGYLFALDVSRLAAGDPRALGDLLRIYPRWLRHGARRRAEAGGGP
ncbi:MAG: radical SAM protein [Myxococcota bacterium]|jgi:pyruvate-formate lyase-activating enzyme|nr:radical SAM protein [Myxococcota bacterium]